MDGVTFKGIIGGFMVLEAILFFGLFQHKSNKKPGPTPEQQAFAKLLDQDRKLVSDGIEGAQAFEKDSRMAQYERPELDAFEQQLYVCVQDTDEQLDKDVDQLVELGNALMALDKSLEEEHVI